MSREDWLRRVEAVLKGASFEEKLVSATADAIRIEPLYGQAQEPRIARAIHAPWTVVQRVDHPDPITANEQARRDLGQGASGLAVVFQGAASAHGFGLAGEDARAIARVLKDIRIDSISLRIEPGRHGCRAADAMAAFLAEVPVDPERLDLSFGMDPIGAAAARGDLDAPWADVAQGLAATVERLRKLNFAGPFATADGRIWHDGGATPAQELGFVLATGAAYLRTLQTLNDDDLARAVDVVLAADQGLFETLAKFRAMRLLWARVLDASGLAGAPLRLHAETSWRMMTARDPQTNILRAAAAVFGAGLGGADSIAVLPFSAAQGLPDRFARRIARNTQTVLLEESQLWRVADPAAGSGYVEHLTQSLCEKAWSLFQETERAQGIVAQLRSGALQQQIAEARERRRARIICGEEIIVGTTRFEAPSEPPAAIEPAAPVGSTAKDGAGLSVAPITAARLTEDFENRNTA